MVDPVQETIEFVTSLPLSTNPYVALAQKIKKETEIAKPVLWGIIIRRIIALQFCILCGQALTVLWLRKKANKLHFFRYNKLGLIHVEVLNETVLLTLIFSVLAVVDLITQEFVEQGSLKFSKKLILRTCKFPISADVCWLFLWICGIETVMSFSSLRARARAGASIRLPPRVCFLANSLLLTALTAPGALLLVKSIQGTLIVREIEAAAADMISTLLQAAPSYQPESYNSLNLFGLILEPTQKFLAETKAFAHNVKFHQILYIVQHLLIATLYLPTSILALRGLRNQVVPECTLKPDSVNESAANYQLQMMNVTKTPAQEMTEQEKVRKRLIIHAFLLYLDTVLYCPPLLYMLSYKGTYFFNDPTWVLIEQLGTHGHTAIIGNIILALLIKNTVYANNKPASSSITRTKIPVDLEKNRIPRDRTINSFST